MRVSFSIPLPRRDSESRKRTHITSWPSFKFDASGALSLGVASESAIDQLSFNIALVVFRYGSKFSSDLGSHAIYSLPCGRSMAWRISKRKAYDRSFGDPNRNLCNCKIGEWMYHQWGYLSARVSSLTLVFMWMLTVRNGIYYFIVYLPTERNNWSFLQTVSKAWRAFDRRVAT
jgi:hypothetical protein